MKQIIVALALTIGPFAAHTDDSDGMKGMMKDPAKWEEHKQKMLVHLEEKLAVITKAKECVTAANSHESLMACHDQIRMEHKEMRKGHGHHGKKK